LGFVIWYFLNTMDFKKFKKRLILFLAVLGPGVITAVANNDAAGVATYTLSASLYGMSAQAFFMVTMVLLAVTQDIGARIAIVTGKGLGDLIREHYGVKISVAIFAVYFVVNQAVVLQNVSGLKAGLQLLSPHWQSLLLVVCGLLVASVVFLNFKSLQKLFLLTIFFYFAYVASALLIKPDWLASLKTSLFSPEREYVYDLNYWFTIIAVLGTTITAWGQFFIHSFVADKGLKPSQIKTERLEVYLGAALTVMFSWLMAVAVSYTLHTHGIVAEDGASAARALIPLAGEFASYLFALGLLGASFLGLTIVPLATAYVFGEFFGFERTLNATFAKGRLFYIFFILQIVLGLLLTFWSQINLFDITLYANYLNGALVPLVFFFLIKFSGDKTLMGEKHVTRGFSRFFLQAASVVIIFAVVVTFVGKLFFNN